MDEQKRLLLAVVLSIVVLVGYQYFFAIPVDQNRSRQVSESATPEAPAPVSSAVTDYTRTDTPRNDAVEVPADARTITVSTPLYEIVISEHSGSVRRLDLKQYQETVSGTSPSKQLVSGSLPRGTLFMGTGSGSINGLEDAVFTADTDTESQILSSGEKTIGFSWSSPQGIRVQKSFTFRADSYLIDCNVLIQNGSDAPLEDTLVLHIPGIFDEEVRKRSRFAFEGPVAYINDGYISIEPDDIKDQDTFIGTIDWIGFSDRYFLTAVMPAAATEGRMHLTFENEVVTNRLILETGLLEPGTQGAYPFVYFMGPKSHKELSRYDNKLKKAINFGFFDILAKPLLLVMIYIHDWIPNYGVAIILLTILIKILFWPLGTKSYKSMNEMKKLQPLMMSIREKYKDDRQKMNQEVMGLYKTYKVNPASGCLPLLVQMPIFFALYRMLYLAIELRHAHFAGWITDLSGPDRLFDFGFSIPMMEPPYGIPVLTLIMGASFFIQQKMTPMTGDPIQAKMMMFMPILMTVLFINFPSGLVLYMFVNNIISMGQQYYTQKKFSK